MKNKIIVIAGSGRSGTTWIQDCIAEANNLKTLFEPLHPVGVPEAEALAFRYRDPGAVDPVLKKYLDRVMAGSHRSLWINYRIRPDRFNLFKVGISNSIFNTRKLIENYRKYKGRGKLGVAVKFIRANLMLPWIVENYEARALFVTRHPCAVIASRMKLGGEDWGSRKSLDRYAADQAVVQLIQQTFEIDIRESFSAVEAFTCVWCIENLLPIQWAAESGYLITAYETLLAEPDREWKRVIAGLGLLNIPDDSAIQKPSQQAPVDMQGKEFSTNHLGSWREVLSSEQIQDISSVLERFTCSIYSVDADLPKGKQLSSGRWK